MAPAFGKGKEKAPMPPTPAIWKVRDADSEIYLFAAAPFLPTGATWRSRTVAALIDRSETIWFEAPFADPAALAAAGRIFEEEGRNAAGKSLSGLLGSEAERLLDGTLETLEADRELFSSFKLWAAFVVLTAELDRKRGADPASSVEIGVLTEAMSRQRPVQFLDSVDGALSALTEMPEKDQRDLLVFLLEDWPRQNAQAPIVYDLWRTGDVEALARLAKSPLKEAAPGAYERLIGARAELLVERISALLSSPDEAFICLSATLVIGDDGIAAMLKSRGFTVERLDARP